MLVGVLNEEADSDNEEEEMQVAAVKSTLKWQKQRQKAYNEGDRQ